MEEQRNALSAKEHRQSVLCFVSTKLLSNVHMVLMSATVTRKENTLEDQI